MKKFAILTDTTCDLGKELREKHDIDYVKMNYVIDGKEYPASLDWEDLSAHDFYDLMRNGTRIRTTQVPREVYTERFTYWLEQGIDVLYIACSSALSGSVNLAAIIAKELAEKYTEAKVICIDSLCSSLGQGRMVITAALMRDEGKDIDEVAAHIEATKLKVNQFGTAASLEYLRRAGRVKASKAFFGNLFGVKPIIISDKLGQNYAFKKVKGAANARKEIASLIAEAVENPEEQCLYISHADVPEDAEAFKNDILALVPFKETYVNYIAPIVGASVGPGTVIVFCYGKEVTIEGRE